MNFELTDEQRMLQDGAARFFADSYGFERRLELARHGGGFSRAIWAEFAQMGWLAAAVPEAHGGLGFGSVELSLLAEEFGRHLVLEPFTACGVFPATLIVAVASEAQQAQWLPKLASGETLVAVAISEPQARGFLDGIECRATPLADGRWSLEGHKSLVVGGSIADRLLVVARCVDDDAGGDTLAVFSLAPNTPGIKLNAYSIMDGSPAADLHLYGVIVQPEARLGADADGRAVGGGGGAQAGLQLALDQAVVMQCAEAVGSAHDVLSLCADYLKTRKQFGVAIGSFQALQHRMAEMAIETSQARASLHRGLQLLTCCDVAERSYDVSGVKAQVVKSVRYVTQQGIQLHGGYGITEEYRVGHHWRRMLLVDALFGSAAHHLTRFVERSALPAPTTASS